jgi:hypothetical protein
MKSNEEAILQMQFQFDQVQSNLYIKATQGNLKMWPF